MASQGKAAAVPRIGRQLDLAGMLLFVAGAACVGWAYAGLERLRVSGNREFKPGVTLPFEMLGEHAHWMRVTWIGAALMIAGLGVAIAAAVVARRSSGAPRPS